MTIDATEFLSSVGFQKGNGFDGEVWTNPDSTWMTQVWVWLSGDFPGGELHYDARDKLDVCDFQMWWEKVSEIEFYRRQV